MSRSSLIIGGLIAVVLHGLLFLPVKSSPKESPPAGDPPANPPKKVKIAPAPAAHRKPPPPAPVRPVQPPKPKLAAKLQPVVPKPAAPVEQQKAGRTATPAKDNAALPPLRIVWASPGQLRRVAGALGMRIVAVNARRQVVGEVTAAGGGGLRDFDGRLDQYSNRVRTLPRSFFGTELAAGSGVEVADLWVLVPAAVDRRWIDLQRRAIARAGLTAGKVRELEAAFEKQSNGYRLVVTRVVSRSG